MRAPAIRNQTPARHAGSKLAASRSARASEGRVPRRVVDAAVTRVSTMSHYSFKISQGDQPPTSSASDCPDDDVAKKEAVEMFADMARDIAGQLQRISDWQIEVTDDTGKEIFAITITAVSK
jgi:hypothetical protein